MTKKAKTMVKIILILLAIYVGLTGYASVIFFQGKMNEIAVHLLAINYAIFLTILIYIAYKVFKTIILARNAVREYCWFCSWVLEIKALCRMLEKQEGPEHAKVLKGTLENLEKKLIIEGEALSSSKLLRKTQKQKIREIIKKLES